MNSKCIGCDSLLKNCNDFLCQDCLNKVNNLKNLKCILCNTKIYNDKHVFCEDCYNTYVKSNEPEFYSADDLLMEYNAEKSQKFYLNEKKYNTIGKLYNIRKLLNKQSYSHFIALEKYLIDCYDIIINNENMPLLTTKDKHQVRSRGELIIDNYLYDNKIRHFYEITLILNNKPVTPDFYLPDFDVYIEYWGYDENSQDKEIADTYEQRKLEKIELYKQNNIKLIEIENKDFEDIYTELDDIFEKLTKNSLPF